MGKHFVIHDFNKDNVNDVFVNVGNYGQGLPYRFEELGLKTREIILHYDQKTKKLVAEEWQKFSTN